MHYTGNIKSILSFKNSIINLIDIFNKKNIYQDNKLSVIRANAYYVQKNDIIDLVNKKNIMKY